MAFVEQEDILNAFEGLTRHLLKEVNGITMITAGFSETSDEGKKRQKYFADLAHSFGMRILGPNVSGTFNLHADFNASSTPAGKLLVTPLAGACQGGYAFYDILSSGWERGIGLGKFIHTGNECDLTVTDFLEHFGNDPEVKAVVTLCDMVTSYGWLHRCGRQGRAKKAGGGVQSRENFGQCPGCKQSYRGPGREKRNLQRPVPSKWNCPFTQYGAFAPHRSRVN